MAQTPPTFELIEPPTTAPLLPRWSYLTLGSLAAGTLLLICLAILLVRRWSRARSGKQENIRRKAWREAQTAFSTLAAENARDAATGVSLILRRYLATALAEPALFETHEETFARGDALTPLPPAVKQKTAEWFTELARLKYAREIGIESPDEIIANARAILETIHHGHPK